MSPSESPPDTPSIPPKWASSRICTAAKSIARRSGERGSTTRCACRKSNPNILVMQPAQDWKAKNTPCPLNRAR